jgi:hypothetical protein
MMNADEVIGKFPGEVLKRFYCSGLRRWRALTEWLSEWLSDWRASVSMQPVGQ